MLSLIEFMNKNTINSNFIPPYTPEANQIEQLFR